MKCNFSTEDIINFSEGCLSKEENDRIRKHIDECEKCRLYFEALSGVESFADEEVPRGKDMRQTILSKIDENRYQKKKRYYWIKGVLSRCKPVVRPAFIVLAICILTAWAYNSRSYFYNVVDNYIGNQMAANPVGTPVKASPHGTDGLSGDEGDPTLASGNEPDLGKMAEKIKKEIHDWKRISVGALDVNKEIILSEEQKIELSKKLKTIKEIEYFDGGFTALREAVYPFYMVQLWDERETVYQELPGAPSFGEYYFAVAGADRLLIAIPYSRYEYYNLSQKNIPIRFLKVNEEFVDYIKTLLPVEPIQDQNDFKYLFNAEKVIFQLADGHIFDGNIPQQVNKCIRILKAALGSKIEKVAKIKDAKEICRFEFVFEDGTTKEVLLTDKYIEWDGIQYEVNGDPDGIPRRLYTGYF